MGDMAFLKNELTRRQSEPNAHDNRFFFYLLTPAYYLKGRAGEWVDDQPNQDWRIDTPFIGEKPSYSMDQWYPRE
jgi:hypothetical protein